MKVKINESQLRHLVGESIRKVLSEAYGTDPHNMVFVTFGKGNSFDVGKMNNKPNEMHRVHLNITNKPFGLWGSPIDDEDGKTAWGKFVEYDYRNIINTLKEHFIFRVKPEAKIFVIDGEDSLRQLPWADSQTGMIHVDWEKVEKMYDGVYLTDNYPRRALDYYTPSFYAWDCASICIFNGNAIEQVEESQDEYNKLRDVYDYEGKDDDWGWDDEENELNEATINGRTYMIEKMMGKWKCVDGMYGDYNFFEFGRGYCQDVRMYIDTTAQEKTNMGTICLFRREDNGKYFYCTIVDASEKEINQTKFCLLPYSKVPKEIRSDFRTLPLPPERVLASHSWHRNKK